MGIQQELQTIERSIGPAEWFDAFVYACLLSTQPYGPMLKLASQKLSNWSTLGHLQRRPARRGKACWEYRLPPTRAELVASPATWIPAGFV